jgi:hypothetical protein
MEGKARILAFGFSPAEEARIDEGLAALGVPAPLKLQPGHGGLTLRSILEGAGEAPVASDGLTSSERLVLFHNVSDAGVQGLMRFFRQTSGGRPIFAVVTPTSIDWTLGFLLEHLREERAALDARPQVR